MYGRSYNVDPSTNKFIHIPDTIQICNFGASHGQQGFNYEDLENEYACFNFGLSAQSLSYDYRLFQYYSGHIAENAVVFIPVSYPMLFKAEGAGPENLSKNKRYYSILPKELIREYDYRTDIYVKFFPALASSTDALVRTLTGKDEVEEIWQSVATDMSISANAKARAKALVVDKDIYHDADAAEIGNQEEIDALYALVKGCQERGAIPVLITTPLPHQLTEAVMETAENFYECFYSLIDQVVKDTGVEYYDYAFDERFVNEYSWFADADHLNKEGARNFTDILMEEIVYAKGYYPEK